MNRYLLCLLSLSCLAAAKADDPERTEADPRRENACVAIGSRLYLQAISERYVYVESAPRKYLMTMRTSCPGLDRGFNIRFKGNKRRVCANSRPALEYDDRHISMPSCRIQTIEEVQSWQEAQGLMMDKEQARVDAENAKRKKQKAEKEARRQR